MLYLIKILVNFLLPPGLFIVIPILLSIFVHNRISFVLIVMDLLILYLLSTPFVSHLLTRSLECMYFPPKEITSDVLVMLGGGATLDTPDTDGFGHLSGSGANRLLTTARLYRQTGLPILLSSGQVFRDGGSQSQISKRQLIELGVPAEKIFTEDLSKNTKQNAIYTKDILLKQDFKNPLLITSAFHMKRSMIEFSTQSIHAVPFPTDYKVSSHLKLYPSLFVPNAHSLWLTELSLHEYLGIFAARMRN